MTSATRSPFAEPERGQARRAPPRLGRHVLERAEPLRAVRADEDEAALGVVLESAHGVDERRRDVAGKARASRAAARTTPRPPRDLQEQFAWREARVLARSAIRATATLLVCTGRALNRTVRAHRASSSPASASSARSGWGARRSSARSEAGASGISPVASFDASPLGRENAGEVKDFEPRDHLTPRRAATDGALLGDGAGRGAHGRRPTPGSTPSQLAGPRTAVVLGTTMGEAQILAELEHEWILRGAEGRARGRSSRGTARRSCPSTSRARSAPRAWCSRCRPPAPRATTPSASRPT